ncbi:MAG TPA: hypothetical protein VGE51_16540 [Fontimonas sp.]
MLALGLALGACAMPTVEQEFGPFKQSVGPGGVQQSAGPFQQSVGRGGVQQSAGPVQQSVTPGGVRQSAGGGGSSCQVSCGGQTYAANCGSVATPVCQCSQQPYAYCLNPR